MADKSVIDKVKELLDSNANASLKEAAKKWLDEVDDKYGLMFHRWPFSSGRYG